MKQKNEYMEEHIGFATGDIILLNENYYSDDARGWLIDHMEKNGSRLYEPVTEEEDARLNDYYMNTDSQDDEGDEFMKMPDDIKDIYIRRYVYRVDKLIEESTLTGDYESIFFMDLTEGYRGMVLLDIRKGRAAPAPPRRSRRCCLRMPPTTRSSRTMFRS